MFLFSYCFGVSQKFTSLITIPNHLDIENCTLVIYLTHKDSAWCTRLCQEFCGHLRVLIHKKRAQGQQS